MRWRKNKEIKLVLALIVSKSLKGAFERLFYVCIADRKKISVNDSTEIFLFFVQYFLL